MPGRSTEVSRTPSRSANDALTVVRPLVIAISVREFCYSTRMDDYEIREVPHEPEVSGTAPLQEGVVVDVATVAAAAFAAGSFGLQLASHRRDAPSSRDAEMAALRWEMHEPMRAMDYELGGLAALDEYDGTDGYYGGFGVGDPQWRGFGVED